MGWRPGPNLAPRERKSRMKESPCRFSRLPLSDSEISLFQYDDFRATGVWVTLELHKGEGSSCSSSQPGQLNGFRASSSCLYLSRITGDEKKEGLCGLGSCFPLSEQELERPVDKGWDTFQQQLLYVGKRLCFNCLIFCCSWSAFYMERHSGKAWDRSINSSTLSWLCPVMFLPKTIGVFVFIQ